MNAQPATIAGDKIHHFGKTYRLYRVSGNLSVHRSFNVNGAWGVSLPTGAGLGQGYPSRKAATAAAMAMVHRVVNPNAMDLQGVFGGKEQARAAYDAAMNAARNSL